MPRLKVIFSRSRRPLMGSLALMIIGFSMVLLVLPGFARSLKGVMTTEATIDPAWPPETQEFFRQQIREAYEAFYLWTGAFAFAVLVAAWGVHEYLKIRKRKLTREQGRGRG